MRQIFKYDRATATRILARENLRKRQKIAEKLKTDFQNSPQTSQTTTSFKTGGVSLEKIIKTCKANEFAGHVSSLYRRERDSNKILSENVNLKNDENLYKNFNDLLTRAFRRDFKFDKIFQAKFSTVNKKFLPLKNQITKEILEMERTRPFFINEGKKKEIFETGLLNGIRTRPVFNPFYKIHQTTDNPKLMAQYEKIRKNLENSPGKDFSHFDPFRVKIGNKIFNLPDDLYPQKDELGQKIAPRIRPSELKEIRTAYEMNNLPFLWKSYRKLDDHLNDKNWPMGFPNFYRNQFRREKIEKALKKVNRKLLRFKRKKWPKLGKMEKAVKRFLGNKLAKPHTLSR